MPVFAMCFKVVPMVWRVKNETKHPVLRVNKPCSGFAINLLCDFEEDI